MAGCVFRVTGGEFDVDAFLAKSTLRPNQVHRRGESRRRGGTCPDSGLKFDVSDADGELVQQAGDAIRFLSEYESELRRLQGFPGVTDLRLDFAYYRREVLAQFDYLPPKLITLAGRLGIGIELSLYSAIPDEVDFRPDWRG